VHLVRFIRKKFVTVHGHMNVKKMLTVKHALQYMTYGKGLNKNKKRFN